MARAQTAADAGKKAPARATAAKETAATDGEATTESTDSPLLDMSDAAVKKLIKTAKQRGFVTHD